MIKERSFNRADRDKYNRTGLSNIYWELFDSQDSVGSGFNYMERDIVLVLDDMVRAHPHWRPCIEIAYVSKMVGDLLGLTSWSPYRIGKGIRLKCLNKKKRMFIVTELVLRGIERIAVSDKYIEFDTDTYLHGKALYIR